MTDQVDGTHLRRDILRMVAFGSPVAVAAVATAAKPATLNGHAGSAYRQRGRMRFLKTKGRAIVDGAGDEVRLRGTCVGGWMNMEDFITGHPGAEHTLRQQMAETIGTGKAEFFFNRLLDHFFNEDDIVFLRQAGVNVVRLPLNYRHFEDDAAPFRYKEAGFARLDQVLRWCEANGLYVILDLHAAQGWQNVHWHCDNASRISLLWENSQYQDRFVALWEEIARRYQDAAVIAGFNLLNEPCTNSRRGDYPWNISFNYKPNWKPINDLYRRTVGAIRKIDRKHIIFLEGDNYSSLFTGLEAPFDDNLVYSSHNYNNAGFGPGEYPGTVMTRPTAKLRSEDWNAARQETAFATSEGYQFASQHGVPLWVGEFGSIYNGPPNEKPGRYRAMDDQIGVFERHGASWTTWTYKDVGVMGMQMLDPASPYVSRIAEILKKKIALGADDWMSWLPNTPVKTATAQLAEQLRQSLGDPSLDARLNVRCVSQALLCFYTGTLMQPLFANAFVGLNENEVDSLLSSFSIKNCLPNTPLIEIMSKYIKGDSA